MATDNKWNEQAIVWVERFSATYLVLLVTQLWTAWFRQYENKEGNGNLISVVSFTSEDPPWMPPDSPPSVPLSGVHHFGDLTLALGYGYSNNPYISEVPSQTPPLGIWFFQLLGIGGFQLGLLFFAVVTIIPICVTGWILLSNLKPRLRIIIICLVIFTSLGSLTSLDRGSLALATMGMLGLSFIFANKKKYVISALIMVLVISIKPYLALMLLFPLFRGAWKYAIGTGVITLVTNLIILGTFPGGFLESLKGLLSGTSRYSGQNSDWGWVTFGSEGIFGLLGRLLGYFRPQEQVATVLQQALPFALVIGIIWLVIALPFIFSPNIPAWISITLLLSSTMMIVPSSQIYTTSWAILAILYFLASPERYPWPVKKNSVLHKLPIFGNLRIKPRFLQLTRWVFLLALIGNLIPWFSRISRSDGTNEQGLAFLMPGMCITFALIFLYFVSDLARNQDSSQVSRN